jgi:MFS transporter, UMF1 family
MIASVSADATPDRLGVPATAWAIYDFGYAMFAYVVFARYLSDWLISDLGHPDWLYTSGQAVAAISLLLLMPLAGVAADVLGRHRPLLALFTMVAVAGAVLVGVLPPDIGDLGVLPLLACGVVSAAATALAFAQFDPMLAGVAPRRNWGTMSGIAVAAGYAGIVLWLAVLADVFVGEGDKQQAFVPVAVIFAVLALPLLLAREPRRQVPGVERVGRGARSIYRAARTRQRGALSRLREQPPVVRLLIGRFLYADAIGTINVFAIVYMSRLGGFSEADKNRVTLLVVAFAAAGALVAGTLARRVGPRRTLLVVIPLFAVGIWLVAGFGAPWTVWLLAPVLGISLGTVYTVDRLFMLALTPPDLRGELFGFFNLIGRVAQALGPFVLWGGTIFVLHNWTDWLSAFDASRVSLGLIGFAALAGLWVIRPLGDGFSGGTGGYGLPPQLELERAPDVEPDPLGGSAALPQA